MAVKMLCHRRNDWQINCRIETPLCWHSVLPTPLSKPWNKCRPFVVEVFISCFLMHGQFCALSMNQTNKAASWPCSLTRVTVLWDIQKGMRRLKWYRSMFSLGVDWFRFLLSTVRTSWPASGFLRDVLTPHTNPDPLYPSHLVWTC